MIFNFELAAKSYQINTDQSINLAISIDFNSTEQVSHFAAPIAKSKALKSDDFIGDVSRGGSCNVSELSLVPHCNGTHTECIGHVLQDNYYVSDLLNDSMIPSLLTTVKPSIATESKDSYSCNLDVKDQVITKANLEEALKGFSLEGIEGLIIRTLPNRKEKLTKIYKNNYDTPFFSHEAMNFIAESKVKHLLVDFPSVDKMFDLGGLSNHRMFWGIEERKTVKTFSPEFNKTITELIYVPESTKDGLYLLDLQIAPFLSDASPSRPLIFPLEQK